MAMQSIGLGRGLDALIRDTGSGRGEESPQKLLIVDIVPNPHQPRKQFGEKALNELASSIKSQGLLQPILVRPKSEGTTGKYEIIAGERRWKACQIAGVKEIPVIVRRFNTQETLLAALVENLQRENLNPVEEAKAISLLKEQFNLSQEELSVRIGKNRSTIANSLRLLSLPESILEGLLLNKISAGHARAIMSLNDSNAQGQLYSLILERLLSVREAEGMASNWKQHGSFFGNESVQMDPITGSKEESFVADDSTCISNKPSKIKKPQSAKLVELQGLLSDILQASIKVTGNETKGKISISYTSQEELASILEKISPSDAS